MVALNIENAQASNYSGLAPYSIPSKNTDGINAVGETEWINPDWAKNWGYFNAIPELKNALLLKAIWNVGKGYETDAETQAILEHIVGCGKDTFKNILLNMDIVKRINGDAYAEIIRADDKAKTIINLKPLDPSSMVTIFDDKGMIKRYEQRTKIGDKMKIKTFKPEEIFHLMHNRIADQIHGISDITSIEKTILADDESFNDMKKVMHFQAKPFIVFKLKTDNAAKIASFAAKIKSARNLGEDMFIPDDENLLSYEVIQVNPTALLMTWRDDLRNKFYRTIGLPQIVPGGGGQSTESESKVIYVAFEQIVMHEQLDIENQVWQQLQLRINLIHPTLIEDLLGIDEKKDAGNVFNVQEGEMNPAEGMMNNGQ